MLGRRGTAPKSQLKFQKHHLLPKRWPKKHAGLHLVATSLSLCLLLAANQHQHRDDAATMRDKEHDG